MRCRADRRAAGLVALAILTMLSGGCGRGGPRVAAVSGVVTLDGKPLDQGKVLLVAEKGPGASGEIDSQGRFTLATEGRGGAPVGTHRIAVVAMREARPAPGERLASAEWLIPRRYGDPDQSGLQYEVQEGSHAIRIELNSRGPGRVASQ